MEGVGKGEEDEVGGDGVVEEEAVGVFGEAEGAGEDFSVDAAFPSFGTEGFEFGAEEGECLGGRQQAGFDGGAVEGGDDVEVEGGGGEREAE